MLASFENRIVLNLQVVREMAGLGSLQSIASKLIGPTQRIGRVVGTMNIVVLEHRGAVVVAGRRSLLGRRRGRRGRRRRGRGRAPNLGNVDRRSGRRRNLRHKRRRRGRRRRRHLGSRDGRLRLGAGGAGGLNRACAGPLGSHVNLAGAPHGRKRTSLRHRDCDPLLDDIGGHNNAALLEDRAGGSHEGARGSEENRSSHLDSSGIVLFELGECQSRGINFWCLRPAQQYI
jgi:hypothetical protein